MYQSRGLPHVHLLPYDIIEISDDSSTGHSSDSDGPISRRARAEAVAQASKQKQDHTLTLTGHTGSIVEAMPSEPPSVQPALQHAQVLPVNVRPQRRFKRIHDSDDEIAAPQIDSEKATATPSTLFIQDDLRAHEPPMAATVSPLSPSVADDLSNVPSSVAGRQAFHSFFARYAGCQHGVVATEPEPAEGADILDLRRAVPETFPTHFQQVESAHVPADSDDTSGHTNSDSDSSMSDFVNNDIVMTPSEIEYLATYIAKVLPLTATSLKSPPPLIRKSPRKRVISSSSSSETSISNSAGAHAASDAEPSEQYSLLSTAGMETTVRPEHAHVHMSAAQHRLLQAHKSTFVAFPSSTSFTFSSSSSKPAR
jgi:hypothetical protein